MENILALVLATLVLVAIPGPNVALIVARSLRHGVFGGVLTTLGTTAGVAAQLILVVVGIAAVLEFAASALSWLKWVGAAYLVLLGIRTWRKSPSANAQPPSAGSLFRQGMLLAVVNPKTLLFNAAFLPQFLTATANAVDALWLAALYLMLLMLGDLLWVAMASVASPWLARFDAVANKVSGGFIASAGIGLALTNRQ